MRIAGIIFTALLLFGMKTEAWPSDRNDYSKVDAHVRSRMRSLGIPGMALALVAKEKIVFLRGYGKADLRREVTPQTPFFIGSLSKSFTALAIMQLYEKGRLDIDTPVRSYIPWFAVADKSASENLTPRHLLNQTSGLKRYPGTIPPPDASLEKAVRTFRGLRSRRPPGREFQYSNNNYVILGLLVETVSGLPFEEYVARNILEPLEMRNTYFSPGEAEKAGLAKGHAAILGSSVPGNQPWRKYLVPAGHMISSAEDLGRYLIAWNNKGVYGDRQILSPAGIDEMQRPPGETGSSYAMGWFVRSSEGLTNVSHSGEVAFFYSRAVFFPEDKWGLVYLVNMNGPSMRDGYRKMAGEIVRLALGGPPVNTDGGAKTYVMILVAFFLVQTVFCVRTLRRLSKWKKRTAGKHIRTGISVIRHFALGLAIFVAMPALVSPIVNSPVDWTFMARHLSIFSIWLLGWIVMTCLAGVLKLKTLIETS